MQWGRMWPAGRQFDKPGLEYCEKKIKGASLNRVARSKKIKKAKFCHKQFQRIEICSDLSKTGQKMAKPFNFWQTVSKKGQMATLKSNSLYTM